MTPNSPASKWKDLKKAIKIVMEKVLKNAFVYAAVIILLSTPGTLTYFFGWKAAVPLSLATLLYPLYAILSYTYYMIRRYGDNDE